jgi:hypothetical protein
VFGRFYAPGGEGVRSTFPNIPMVTSINNEGACM